MRDLAATVFPAIFPQSRASAERYGGDPLAMLPLSRLHPAARARITYNPHPATELDDLAEWTTKLMTGDEWQYFLERCDHRRARLAEAYRDLLDDEVGR